MLYIKIWLSGFIDSWKLKWSSGDTLFTNYFRKAPVWNPVWSNHESWRKWEREIGNWGGRSGISFLLDIIFYHIFFLFFLSLSQYLESFSGLC